MTVLPRDFVETREGLVFAVVDGCPEQGRVLCFLRYLRDPSTGLLHKVDTAAANAWLHRHFPHYLYHSGRLDADLHAVAASAIARHHEPRRRLQELLTVVSSDPLEARLRRLVRRFIRSGIVPDDLGVTGSLLLGAQTPHSDIDLVAYGRPAFQAARNAIRQGLAEGVLRDLEPAEWAEAYRRRGCALSLRDFIWHERRKANKAVFEGTKFDLTQVCRDPPPDPTVWRKRGRRQIRAVVIDASAAFDHPARYRIDHPELSEICVYTHTYVGQACNGETVEATGLLEQAESGTLRLLIGSSREAPGEYLRVLTAGSC